MTTDMPHVNNAISTELYTKGFILGSISSVAYSAANVFLRSVDHCDAVWVSCVKAVPTFAIMIPFNWILHKHRASFKALKHLNGRYHNKTKKLIQTIIILIICSFTKI